MILKCSHMSVDFWSVSNLTLIICRPHSPKSSGVRIADGITLIIARNMVMIGAVIGFALMRKGKWIAEEKGEIIVSDLELRVSEYKPLDSVEYRKNVTWSKLVRCKDCKYFDGQELCNRHFIFVGNDTQFFCRDGKWKDDPSHPFADDVMMERGEDDE